MKHIRHFIENTLHTLQTHHLTIFRILFGSYFFILFARLLPWSTQLYSNQGVFADSSLNPVAPFVESLNPLYTFDDPTHITLFLLGMMGLSACVTLGFRLRTSAVFLWIGWAFLWHRNNFTLNPSLPFNGFIMLAFAFLPANLPHTLDRWLHQRLNPNTPPPPNTQHLPHDLWRVVWIVTALAYSFSGYTKLISPSWANGDAISLILSGPLARPLPHIAFLLSTPILLKLLTWATITTELLYAPLSLHRSTRWISWGTMVLLHVGLVSVLQFAELSLGMLLTHLFLLPWSTAKPHETTFGTIRNILTYRDIPLKDHSPIS